MTKATCQTCPFWQSPNDVKFGQCRFKAPKVGATRWAETTRDEWCGKHPVRQQAVSDFFFKDRDD